MAQARLNTTLGRLEMATPLIAASGTVGSVWEWAEVADVRHYGAAVAKSVAQTPWPGREPPRLAPTGHGMLNGIGIQNPGIDVWVSQMGDRISRLGVPVWGSAVGTDPDEFAHVARSLGSTGVAAVELNLSCPNLDDGQMFSFDADRSRDVVAAARAAVDLPIGAKLSPNTPDPVAVTAACVDAGADFVVLTNTALGFGVSLRDRRPLLSGGTGGYSGPGLKPIALRCVYEVSRAFPGLDIVGCGGAASGADVVEYLIAGAKAVELGTVHLAEPKAGARIARELIDVLESLEITRVDDVVSSVESW